MPNPPTVRRIKPEQSVPNNVSFGLLLVAQGLLIAAITLIVVGLPAIERELGGGTAGMGALNSAYGVSFAVLLLAGGRLADLAGRRRMLTLGSAGFALASGLGAVAPRFEVLLVARLVQGAAAALVAPAAMALLESVFTEPAGLARARAVWGGVAPVGATVGTLLSGAAAAWVGWRWEFAAPAVMAALVAALAPRLLPSDRGETGAILRWVPPIEVLASRRRGGALLAVLCAAATNASATLLVSLFLQLRLGFSPIAASAAFLPFCAAQIALVLMSGRLVARIGPRAASVVGLAVAGAGLLLLSGGVSGIPASGAAVGAGLVVLPAGVVVALAGAMVLATRGSRPGEAGLVSALPNTAMEAGPPLGSALLLWLAATGGYQVAFAAAAGGVFAIAGAARAIVPSEARGEQS